MIGDVIDIRREETLIRLMHARGDVGPPEEGLHRLRAVVGADLELDHGFARMQADAVHAFHAGHRIVVAAPDGRGAVVVVLDFDLDGHEGAGR